MEVKSEETIIIALKQTERQTRESGKDHESDPKLRENLTSFKEFELSLSNGYLERLQSNEYFQSLSLFEQCQAVMRCIDNRIKELDLMADELMRRPSTWEQGLKVNLAAQMLYKAKIQLISDSADQLNLDVEKLLAAHSESRARF